MAISSAFLTPPTSPLGGDQWGAFALLPTNAKMELLGTVVTERPRETRAFFKGARVVVFYRENAETLGYYFEAEVESAPNGQGICGVRWASGWEMSFESMRLSDLIANGSEVSPLGLLYAHYWNYLELKRQKRTVDDPVFTGKGFFVLVGDEMEELDKAFKQTCPFASGGFAEFVGAD